MRRPADFVADAFAANGFTEPASAVRVGRPPGWMSVQIAETAVRLAVEATVTRYERAVIGLAPLSVVEATSSQLRAEVQP